MFYFYGKWKRKIDDRGRIYPPPVFRKKLKKCIITLNKGNIQICEKGELPFPEIYPLKLDKERRISIPLQLREGWTGKVVELIGKGEYLEIRRI